MPTGIYERPSAEERFWAKVDQNGPISSFDGTLCWLWTGSTYRYGYGEFCLAKKCKLAAHRFAYELLVGPIPDGYDLDHRATCPKNCVNPSHLRPVLHKQNGENRAGANTNGKSGVRGVCWFKPHKKWVVQVGHNYRRHFGGYFDDLVEAEAAAIALRNRLFTHNDMDRIKNQLNGPQ